MRTTHTADPYSFLADGGELGELTRNYDWSSTSVGTPDQWPQSLRTTLGIILNSKFPMFLWWGNDLVQFYNDAYRPSLGDNGKHPAALGQKGRDCWPEIWPTIKPLIDQVLDGGEATWSENQFIPIHRNGRLEDVYWTFSYGPVKDESGQVSGVLVTCTETTGAVMGRRKLEASEARFRSLINEAPVATCLLVGREMTIEVVNDKMLGYWGKDRSIVGQPLEEAVPALTGQPFPAILNDVLTTGETYEKKGVRAESTINGVLSTHYFNFTYKPLRNATGDVYAIVVTAVDVTQEVSTKQALAISETYLRQLTDTVPAIIWTTEPDGYCTYLNKQWYDYTGQTPEEAEGFGWLDATHPDDKQEAGRLFVEANEQQKPFSALYRLLRRDGSYRWAIDKGAPRFSAAGVYEGMVGTVVDVHDKRLAEIEQQKLALIIEASHEFIGMVGVDLSIQYCNPAALTMLGWTDVAGKSILDCVYPDDRPLAQHLIDSLIETGYVSHDIRFMNVRTGEPFWLQWNGVTINDPTTHEVIALATVSPNITERRKADQALRESEERFQAAVVAVQGIVWTNNDAGQMAGEQPGWAALTGQTYDEYQGYGWSNAIHPDDVQPSIDAWQEAIRGSRPFVFEHRVRQHDGHWGLFSIRAIPLMNTDGSVREWVGVHTDITEQRRAVQALKASEYFSSNLFHSSPVANLVLVGEKMTIRTINEGMLTMLGRDTTIIGKPFMVAVPELIPTPLLDRLRHVLATGETYYQPEERIELVRYGQPHTGYYNYIYSPLSDAAGERNGVIVTAIEVTQQVTARQKIEEAEGALRGAIELAELGTWQIDLATGIVDYSDRLRVWFGIGPDEVITIDRAYRPIRESDRPLVKAAITQAIAAGIDGRYNVEYTVDAAEVGRERILKAQGKVSVNERGETIRISGTVQDVTEQRRLQLALEQQVQQRTGQLQASVQDLERSNANLQQFAYVASHDLQEPLRKIQSFGDLLKNQYAVELGEGVDHLERMQLAAGRMSTLIRDLLTFSRISTQQDTTAPVALTDVVSTVLTDLELLIQETGAQVIVDALPTVPGDRSQLGQLVQNLLSNALKFRRKDTPPVIRISTRYVAAADLPPSVRPTRLADTYHRIDVADNGIGFDAKYVDRIFQVFQRLHGRNEFAGTGIGLAICEKVAANHGGAITATSQPGQGATFSVYLPG